MPGVVAEVKKKTCLLKAIQIRISDPYTPQYNCLSITIDYYQWLSIFFNQQ